MTMSISGVSRLPLTVKVAFTAFMALLAPVYLANYGPTNFLYFCDMALILTLVGVWTESALPVSMAAVGILAPQVLWVVDFVANLLGFPLTGMTDYMFSAASPKLLRGLSLFHGWLPFLLVYLVAKLGYDRRALFAWSGLAWAAMFIAYFFLPGPRPDAGLIPVNVDYVYGMSDVAAQSWMPGSLWFALMLATLPALIFAPTHLVLARLWGAAEASEPQTETVEALEGAV